MAYFEALDPKIGMESQFGSNSMMEFVWKIPPKFGWPTMELLGGIEEKGVSHVRG